MTPDLPVFPARLLGHAKALARAGFASLRPPLQARRVAPWFAVDGDRTLRLRYDLNASSTVLDVGGYEGQWASDIFAMYGCTVHVFEPAPAFASRLSERFARNPRISVHPFGLGGTSRADMIHLSDDATSVVRGSGSAVPIRIVAVDAALEELGLGSVELMKVNIEGLEYELIERLLDTGKVAAVRDLQVQFHDFVPDAERRLLALQERLGATHALTYQYPYVWENWRLR